MENNNVVEKTHKNNQMQNTTQINQLKYSYLKNINKHLNNQKDVIIVENQTAKDLIQENWIEVFEFLTSIISKYNNATIYMLIFIKFCEDRNFEFTTKCFRSNLAIVEKDNNTEKLLNNLCEDITRKTEDFEKENEITCDNYVTKIVINLENIFEQDFNRLYCIYCALKLENEQEHLETTEHELKFKENSIAKTVINNTKPNCLSLKNYIASIKSNILTFTNSFCLKAESIKLCFDLYCEYVKFDEFNSKDQHMLKRFETKEIEIYSSEALIYEDIINEFLKSLTCFKSSQTDWHLERFYCLKININDIKEKLSEVPINPCQIITQKLMEVGRKNEIATDSTATEMVIDLKQITAKKNFKRLYCIYCEHKMDNAEKHFQTTEHKLNYCKENAIAKKIVNNTKPSCLNLKIFIANIKFDIVSFTNSFCLNAASITLSFDLYCEYVKFNALNSKYQYMLKRFETEEHTMYSSKSMIFEGIINGLLISLADFKKSQTDWELNRFYCFKINIKKTQEKLSAKQPMPVPDWIVKKRACVAVNKYDIFSFKWAIIFAAFPEGYENSKKPKYPISNIHDDIIKLENGLLLNFKGLKFPMDLQQFDFFEEQNPDITIGVFGCDEKLKDITGPHFRSTRSAKLHIHLLFLKRNDQYHFIWIKHLSRLIRRHLPGSNSKPIFCQCYNYFNSEKSFAVHICKPERIASDQSVHKTMRKRFYKED